MALTKVIGNGLGAVTQDGAATFNEGSADVDFRVESNSNANMLFVNGGTDKVGINTNSPTGMLTIDSGFLQVDVSGTQGIRVGSTDQIAGGTTNDGAIQSATSKAIRFYNGGTESMRIRSDGSVTMPLQPAFSATRSSTLANFATNSMVTINLNSEVYDQNGDFSDPNFTAPVTGKYQLSAIWYMNALDITAAYYILRIVTSNRTYDHVVDSSARDEDETYSSYTLSVLADMDASDTASIALFQQDGAAQTDITGGTYFTGYLVC